MIILTSFLYIFVLFKTIQTFVPMSTYTICNSAITNYWGGFISAKQTPNTKVWEGYPPSHRVYFRVMLMYLKSTGTEKGIN